MTEPDTWSLNGFDGARHAVRWSEGAPRHIALLSHGYGEHIGRYQYVADALVQSGAAVYGIDHVGHGRSEGDRVVIEDYDSVVDDLHKLDLRPARRTRACPSY